MAEPKGCPNDLDQCPQARRAETRGMPVLNSDIARSLDKLADLLELDGANPFRIRAYRNAARVVGELPRSITAMTAAILATLPVAKLRHG